MQLIGLRRPIHQIFADKMLWHVAIEAATVARTTMNSILGWLDEFRAYPFSKDQCFRSN